jgi:hypothetical protein
MSGHRASRRQSYGRRQKDVRDRHLDAMEVDLEGPSGWLRAGGWSEDGSPSAASSVRGVIGPDGGRDRSLGSAGA